MGAMVVLVLAIVIVLVAAVGVAVWRLARALQGLTATMAEVRETLQPTLDELRDGAETTNVEVEALQASIDQLTSRRNGHG
jgi:predicted PurR-regulated permease PerM